MADTVQPTPDDELGMKWWNALNDRERARWAAAAGTGRAVDAWMAFKAATRDGTGDSAGRGVSP